MKVCLLTDSDVFAGTERHILDLALGLRETGTSAVVGCPGAGELAKRSRQAGVQVLPIEKRGAVDLDAVRTLSRRLRSGQIEVIHAHNGRTALASALALRKAGRGSLVFTQHFIGPHHTTLRGVKAALARAAHRWVNGRISQYIAISDAVRQAMLARCEAPPDRITIVPNGISMPSDPNESPQTRADLGLDSHTPLLVCVARLEPEKGIEDLIAAMPKTLESHPCARLVIVGDGSQKEFLHEMCRALGVSGPVQFLGYRDDAIAFIRAADVFVLPSHAEPFGLVLLEAMACGKPVIATDAGGPREIVEHGKTGLLVAPRQPQALAYAICDLLSSAEKRKAMGENGYRRYLEYYTVRRMAEQTARVYDLAVRSISSAKISPDSVGLA